MACTATWLETWYRLIIWLRVIKILTLGRLDWDWKFCSHELTKTLHVYVFQVTIYYSLVFTDPRDRVKRYLSNTWNRTTTKWAISSENVANTFYWSSGAMITYPAHHSKSILKSNEKKKIIIKNPMVRS